MSRRLGLPGILRRSLIHRRARSFSALIAMTVSAAVATALLTLYADLDAKLHHEFRSFGANIVLTAPTGSALPTDILKQVQTAAGTDALAAPFAYAVASTDTGSQVVVAGTDFDAVRRLDSWWQVSAWPASADGKAALLGQRAASFVGNQKSFTLTYSLHSITLTGAGRIQTGGDEDSRIYLPLEIFTRWTGLGPTVIELQVPGSAAHIETVIAALQRQFPGVHVEPVRQLVEGESKIVDRTHALMYGSVLLIALTVAVSVLATLSASVLERRRDFALMKALGGTQGQLIALFLLEALVLAGAGVVAGFLLGSIAAWAISEANFHTATLPRVSVLPIVLILNILIAFSASLLPVRVLRGLEPAALLKGE